MRLHDTIQEHATRALRSHDQALLGVLRMLLAALHNREIEKRAKDSGSALSDEEVIAVIRSEVKKRRDSIEQFGRGGRTDLVERESGEMALLETYLPREIPDDAIDQAVAEVIGQIGSVSDKDFGKIMARVMARLKGQASGDRVAAAVKRLLSHG